MDMLLRVPGVQKSPAFISFYLQACVQKSMQIIKMRLHNNPFISCKCALGCFFREWKGVQLAHNLHH